MAINPFTKSGVPVVGAIGVTLQKLVNSNPAFQGLVNSIFQATQANASVSSQVVSDYRKASMQLPKYYKEGSLEKLATIQIVNAIPATDSTFVGPPEKSSIDAVVDGADNQPMNSFILKRVQESFRPASKIAFVLNTGGLRRGRRNPDVARLMR